jgi:hypothetical protein
MAKAQTKELKKPAISETDIRLRCIEAATQALRRGPGPGEAPAQFASLLFALGNSFYDLASKNDPAIALRAVEAAANAMQNARVVPQATQMFCNDTMAVAQEFCGFASGAKNKIGYDHLADVLKKT